MSKVNRFCGKEWIVNPLFRFWREANTLLGKNIEETVEEILENILKDTNIEIFDVEYVKEKDWYLRIYIDKSEGVDHNDCALVSGKIEKELDALDLIKNPYILEVSSPGLDRVLKKPKDFLREIGKKLDLTFFAPVNGKKEMTGVLTAFDGETLTIDVENNSEKIPMEKIGSARLHIDF